MIRNNLHKLSLLCAVAFAAAGTGHAQSTTQGAIAGTVFDATNAAVPNAAVRIHNDGTNTDLSLSSDSSGYFKAPQLDPGTYTVTVSASGFSDLRETNVTVLVSNVTELSPHLAAGSTGSQTVEVSGEIPVIKFDTPAFGGQLDNAEIENIPINNRRWSSLTLLTPGAANDNQGFGLISFRAIQPQLNNVQIDGTDDNQVFYGEERGRTRAGYSTAQTAVREFQVFTGVYSAEFGRAVGGVINSVTKSGTNQLHGELYFYHRDQQWGASNNYVYNVAYNTATGTALKVPFKAKDKRNQYGFGIGGPLIKDKLFGFYAFDQYRRVFPGTGTAQSLTFFAPLTTAQSTQLARSIYLATNNANYNPDTQTGGNATTAPANASAAYNSYIALANTDLGQVPRIGFQIINTPKLDWQVNDKNRVSVLYHRLRWDSPGGVQTQQNVFYAKEGFATDFVKLDYGVGKLDSQVTAKISNELRYQYGRELNDEGSLPNNQFTNQLLNNATGIAPQVNLNTSGGVGFIAGQPYYAFRPALPDERKWQIGDTAVGQYGNHSLKAGVDIVHNNDVQTTLGFSGYSPNGTYNYTSVLASAQDILTRPGVLVGSSPILFQANAAGGGGGCGTGTAAFSATVNPANYVPVGCYQYYRQTIGPTPFSATNIGGRPYSLSTVDYGFFVQDDWKFRPNLTLNLGARYDYESIPDQQSDLVASIPQSNSHVSDKNNISPRVGFAWDPYGQGKTVFRGGYGMYYGRIPNVAILGARFQSGSANGQLSYNFSSPSNGSVGGVLQAFPGAPLFSQRPADATLRNSGLPPDIQYIDPNFKNPYTEEFDLAFQQDLGLNTIISATYLGALSRELPNSLNLNINPANGYTVNYTAVAGSTGTCGPLACGTVVPVKVYGQRAVTATGTTPVNLNNNFGQVSAGLSNVNANYHALSIDVTKRGGKWVSYDANYTWAKALDYNQTAITAISGNNFFDPYGNGRANYGVSTFNIRHRATGWASFTVPGTKGIRFVDAATNGWSIRPAFQMQSGLPYSGTISSTPPSQCTAIGCLQPTNTGLSGVGVTYIPALGRNTFQYPRDIVLDMRVQKDFKVTEKANLQFIIEAFNLPNHQNYTTVTTTAYSLTGVVTPTTNAATPTGNLTFNPLVNGSGFGALTSSNSNFAYSPRNIQAGARLFF